MLYLPRVHTYEIVTEIIFEMTRFNIAYIPKYQSEKFVNLADEHKTKTYNYCLGENSLPHVTISQFIADESQIGEIWGEICSFIEDQTISLVFNKLSNISFDGTIFWLSLLPEPNKSLIDVFNMVSKIVKPIRNDKYDPHLTLFNYHSDKLDSYSSIKSGIKIEDEFELVLGESDDIGQLKNIIFYFLPNFTISSLAR